MFDPDEYVFACITMHRLCGLVFNTRETEKDWDKDLADDVKGECESKYGKVLAIKVERDSQVSLLFFSPGALLIALAGRNLC